MPEYRISAQFKDSRKTAAYRTSKGTFATLHGDAQVVTLTPTEARNWLSFTWYHFKLGWKTIAGDPIWKRHRIDQIRFVLEEIESEDSTSVAGTTADDWESMTVTSSNSP